MSSAYACLCVSVFYSSHKTKSQIKWERIEKDIGFLLSKDDQEKEKLKGNPIERKTLSIVLKNTLGDKYHKSNKPEI